MNEGKKMFMPISQDEAGYVSLSATKGQACANCRFYQYDQGFSTCLLIDNHPDPIINTGWCKRWEGEPEEPELPAVEPTPVVIVGEVDMGYDLDKSVEKALQKPSVIQRFWDALPKLLRSARPTAQFKAIGNGFWVGWYSNNFEDRDEEIVAAEGHDKFIRRLKAGIMPMPELRFWHIPGSGHGKALWVDRIDHMMVAVGRYDDTPLGHLMEKHYETTDRAYGMSQGFTATKSKHFKNGVWYDLNTFEISTLPPEKAANVMTLFSEVKSMASQESLALLKDILVKGLGQESGEAEFQNVLSVTETMNKEAEKLGVRYKDFTDPAKVDAPASEAVALEALSKNVAPLLVDLTKDLADTVHVATAQATEIDALKKGRDDDRKIMDGLKTQVELLTAQMGLTPRRASQSGDTALAQEVADKLKERAGEVDDFWADLKVTK